MFKLTKVLLCASLSLVALGCASGDPAVPVSRASCEPQAGVKSFAMLPTDCLKEGIDYRMSVETDRGTLNFDLFEQSTPLATGSMVFLSRSGFYDSTKCHRAIRDFVLQCGDPTGSGAGGPGYAFQDELNGQESYPAGTLAMANSGPNTNGSQFFIVSGDGAASLPPSYTVFGKLLPGQEELLASINKLGNPDPSANGVPPAEYVTIKSVSVTGD